MKAKCLSVDPYMRGRMIPATNYTRDIGRAELMQGGGVGEVAASNHPVWKPGGGGRVEATCTGIGPDGDPDAVKAW